MIEFEFVGAINDRDSMRPLQGAVPGELDPGAARKAACPLLPSAVPLALGDDLVSTVTHFTTVISRVVMLKSPFFTGF